MEIDITKMSSKGQVVIPFDLRKGFKEGDKLIVIKSGDKLILKKAGDVDENFKEDFEFARRTEEAYKKIDRGEYIEMDFDEFVEEMKKW
mgnify:CR=1 FL=1